MKNLTESEEKFEALTPALPNVTPQSLINLLVSLKKLSGEKLVSYNQATALVSIKLGGGSDYILTMEDRPFIYEIINMLYTLDYEIVYNFLSTNWETVFGADPNIRKKILFENPLMGPAKTRQDMDMEIFRGQIQVVQGAVDCRRCGSGETLSLEKQNRGADEATSIRVTCLQCGYKWSAQ